MAKKRTAGEQWTWDEATESWKPQRRLRTDWPGRQGFMDGPPVGRVEVLVAEESRPLTKAVATGAFLLPPAFVMRLRDWQVLVDVETAPERRPRIIAVRIDPAPSRPRLAAGRVARKTEPEGLTVDRLRLPITSLLEKIVYRIAVAEREPGLLAPAYEDHDRTDVGETYSARVILDDAHYKRVANAYREGLTAGSPRSHVAAVFSTPSHRVPEATASRWIRHARDRGLLGEPKAPGVAGDERRRT